MMDVGKISMGATRILDYLSEDSGGVKLDAAEKIAALRSAAEIIAQTLHAEAFKASMVNLMGKLLGPEK